MPTARLPLSESKKKARTSENRHSRRFGDLEAEGSLARRLTMTPPIGQEEAKDRGFFEEALAGPGG